MADDKNKGLAEISDYNNDYYAVNFSPSVYEDNYKQPHNLNPTQDVVIVAVVLFLVTVLTLFGHTMVLVMLALYRNLRMLTNTLTANLVVSDLIFTLGLPFLTFALTPPSRTGELLVKVMILFFHAGFYSSTLFVLMMAVHRYLVTAHLLSDTGSHARCYGIALSVIAWTVSFWAALTALSDQLQPETQSNLFFIFLCVDLICLVIILRAQCKTARQQKDRKVKFASIVAVYSLLWNPFTLMWILYYFIATYDVRNETMFYAGKISVMIACSYCCVKPILYILIGNALRSYITNLFGRNRDPPTSDHNEISPL